MATLLDLTVPQPGSTTTRRLLGQHLKHTLKLLFELPMGRFPAPLFDDFGQLRASVERLLRDRQPSLPFAIARRVTHSTLVYCLHRELYGDGDVQKLDAWLTELTALIALELTLADALPPGGVRLAAAPPRLLSLSANLELTLPPGWQLGFEPGALSLERGAERVRLPLGDVDRWRLPEGGATRRPYVPIEGELVLALADNNPLWAEEAHPDKLGNALDLGERSAQEWIEALRAALALVDAHLPALGQELRWVMQTIVPVGYDPERHLSASYGECIGQLYLTLHPDPLTLSEALIHEFSHNKINAQFHLDGVLENAFFPLYPSPVRPDPRPLHGVLLAVHAFIPVACLYEQLEATGHPLSAQPRFQERFRKILQGNHEGTVTLLEHARPTPFGRALFDELRRWDDHFAPRRR